MKSIPDLQNKRVLEVGCGTGAFTKEILKTLNDGDEFHIVELNKKFCDTIEESILKQFRNNNSKIEVVLHNTPIEDAGLEGKFDAIICGLPFNNFPVKFVRHLFDVMFNFLKPGCELAYFEYLGILKLKRLFGFPKLRKETKVRTNDFESRYKKQHGSQMKVWRNIPSCRVVRLRAC